MPTEELTEIQLGVELAIFAFRKAFERMNGEAYENAVEWDKCEIFQTALEAEQTLRDLLSGTPAHELTEQHIKLRDSLNRLAPNAAKMQQQANALSEQANAVKQQFESFVTFGAMN